MTSITVEYFGGTHYRWNIKCMFESIDKALDSLDTLYDFCGHERSGYKWTLTYHSDKIQFNGRDMKFTRVRNDLLDLQELERCFLDKDILSNEQNLAYLETNDTESQASYTTTETIKSNADYSDTDEAYSVTTTETLTEQIDDEFLSDTQEDYADGDSEMMPLLRNEERNESIQTPWDVPDMFENNRRWTEDVGVQTNTPSNHGIIDDNLISFNRSSNDTPWDVSNTPEYIPWGEAEDPRLWETVVPEVVLQEPPPTEGFTLDIPNPDDYPSPPPLEYNPENENFDVEAQNIISNEQTTGTPKESPEDDYDRVSVSSANSQIE